MRSSLTVVSLALLLGACGGAQPGPGAATPDSVPVGTTPGATDSPSGAEAESGAGTVIAFKVPAVGSERTETQDFTLVMQVSEVDGGKATRTEQFVEKRGSVQRSKVLETAGGAVTKKRVRYERHEVVRTQGEHSQSTPSPLTGKTYVLSLEGGKLKVTREDGEAVSEIEREKVAEDNRSFGQPPRFAAFVPKHPLKPGDTFKPDREALFEMFGPGDKDFGDVEFRFEGEEKDGGVRSARFSFVATISEKSGVTMESKGHVILLVDSGWPLELVMAANVKLDAPGRGPGQKVTGRGQAQMILGAKYH